MNIHFPTLAESVFLLPMTLLFIFGLIPVTLKVSFNNQEPSNAVSLACALSGILVAAVATVCQWRWGSHTVFSGALIFDRMSVFSGLLVLLITALCLMMSIAGVNTQGRSFAEHVFLVLMSAIGMLTLVSAADLMVSFIGLEIMSIALYVLIGIGHEQQYSKEASLKYFILGSFASAIFLYGIAFLYGTTGSTQVSVIASHAQIFAGGNRLFVMGLVLLLVGIGFKVSLVPFHAWTPDVYQGAPTSISAFMATGVKVVMFTLFLRLVDMQMFFADERIITGLSFIAVATMVFGNVTALVQDNIKRIIAYSSIAHAGYILVGVIAALRSGDPEASSAVLFYVLSYSIMNLGAFAVVNMVEKEERGQLSITDYAGLGFKYPLLGVALAVFMLSLAGIPPTVGFIGKFYLFAAAYKTGFVWLAVLGVINSLLSVYYYLRVLVYLYMKEEVFSVRVDGTVASNFVIVATMAATLLLGIFSAPFLLKM